jgi:hypothetical protein
MRIVLSLLLMLFAGACAPRYTTSTGAPPEAYLNSGDARTAHTVTYRMATGRSWFKSLVDGLARAHAR